MRLLDLHPDPLTARADRHAIAAYRSRRVDVRRWVERLVQLRDSFKRLPTSFDSIQGILNRLQLLAEGELGRMLGAGDDSLTIEELAWPQGLAVIEAGEGEALSAFTKSLLFSIIAWRIYTDAVKRWQQATHARRARAPHRDRAGRSQQDLRQRRGRRVIGSVGRPAPQRPVSEDAPRRRQV